VSSKGEVPMVTQQNILKRDITRIPIRSYNSYTSLENTVPPNQRYIKRWYK